MDYHKTKDLEEIRDLPLSKLLVDVVFG